ncbi:MAG: LAGLIDADG family homing endonuclease [Candidatus Colwellbacteria bacterium]
MILTNEYIRGLVDGEGCFTFYPLRRYSRKTGYVRKKMPAFVIAMHERDEALLYSVKETLGLSTKIYQFKAYTKDGYKRGNKAVIVVRGMGPLKNVIIPLFYGKLRGYKATQFLNWLEKIGTDPEVIDQYKLLYRLHKTGYFERELSSNGLFRKFLN